MQEASQDKDFANRIDSFPELSPSFSPDRGFEGAAGVGQSLPVRMLIGPEVAPRGAPSADNLSCNVGGLVLDRTSTGSYGSSTAVFPVSSGRHSNLNGYSNLTEGEDVVLFNNVRNNSVFPGLQDGNPWELEARGGSFLGQYLADFNSLPALDPVSWNQYDGNVPLLTSYGGLDLNYISASSGVLIPDVPAAPQLQPAFSPCAMSAESIQNDFSMPPVSRAVDAQFECYIDDRTGMSSPFSGTQLTNIVSAAAMPRSHPTGSQGPASPRFSCNFPGCTKDFNRQSDRIRHENSVHLNIPGTFLCHVTGCLKSQGSGYKRADKLTEHLWKKHANLGYTKA